MKPRTRRSEHAQGGAPTRPTAARPGLAAWWPLAAVAAVVLAIVLVQWASPAAQPPRASRGAAREPEENEMPAALPPAARMRVRVVQRYPHDPAAFTQGLIWHEGHLYESTGQYGRSSVRRVRLETGEVLEQRPLERRFFGEGLARVGDRLVQLTWTEGEAHVWGLADLAHRRTFRYRGEGWGLCFDGRHLVMSDGSDRLVFRDPETFREVRRVRVRLDGEPLDRLNELECVDGEIWANVWQTDEIVRIDPASGRVAAVVDASGLLSGEDEARYVDVLNGIAWVPERRHFLITGKLWPRLFEVEFVPAGG